MRSIGLEFQSLLLSFSMVCFFFKKNFYECEIRKLDTSIFRIRWVLPLHWNFLERKERVNHNEILIEFVRRLRESKGKERGWKDRLLEVFDKRKSSKKVREIINECLEEVKNG